MLESIKVGLPGQTIAPQLAPPQRVIWHPPNPPRYKLNIDAALDKDGGVAGLGCIIRNYQGAVMAAVTSKKPCLGDVEIAEALTALEGLKLAAEVRV